VTGADLPADLPRLSGPDGTSVQVYNAYRDFQEALGVDGLKISALTLTARRSWQLELQGEADDQGLTVVLDHDQPRRRLERFMAVYRSNLASQLTAIRQVDLRYANGFAVQWRRGFEPPRVAHRITPGGEG
jgi:cell division protein FtsQ